MHETFPIEAVKTAAPCAITPSPRTRHDELLRLCARIGYSPPRPSMP